MEITLRTLKHHMFSSAFCSHRANAAFIVKWKVSKRGLCFWHVSNMGMNRMSHTHSMDKISIVNFYAIFYTVLEITMQNYYWQHLKN